MTGGYVDYSSPSISSPHFTNDRGRIDYVYFTSTEIFKIRIEEIFFSAVYHFFDVYNVVDNVRFF